jgi:hypothetical protein
MRRMSALSWFGIALSVLFVALALRQIEFTEFSAALRKARWGWVLPALALYFLGHVFRGLRSRLILRPHTEISWVRAMNLILAGYAANNVLPARLGELIRTYVLGRLQEMSKATALSTVFVERVFDGLAIVGILLAVTAGWHDRPAWATTAIALGGAGFLGAFVCILGVVLLERRFLVLASTLLRPFPARLASRALAIFERLLRGMDFLRSARVLGLILLLSLCVWLAEGAMFWATLPVFGLEPSAAMAYFATCITNLGIVLPSSPGYAGTFHYFCALALGAFGVPASTAVAYAVVVHAVHFIPVTFIGIWALHHYGFGLSRVAHEAEEGSEA